MRRTMEECRRRNRENLLREVACPTALAFSLLLLLLPAVFGSQNIRQHPSPDGQMRSSVGASSTFVRQSLEQISGSDGAMPIRADVVEGDDGSEGDLYDAAKEDSSQESRSRASRDRKLLSQGKERKKSARGVGKQMSEDKELTVAMLHRSHPDSPVFAKKVLTHEEHVLDRIQDQQQRVRKLKAELHAKISKKFPTLSDATNSSNYDFSTPVVSGSTLGSGQYFIEFYLGTPPQKFSLIADTGSDLIWVQCPPCISCYSQNGPIFMPQDSSTYSPLTCASDLCQFVPAPLNFTCEVKTIGCAYAYMYADESSTQGVFSTDTATMNVSKDGKNVQINNVAFGCGNLNMGPSLTGAGGVIGLGQGPTSFPSQIGGYFGNRFSYCLVDYFDAPSVSSTLVFGSGGTKRSKEQAQYTPFIHNQYAPTFYYLGIQSVAVAGKTVPIPDEVWGISEVGDGGTIIDSGTTLTVFLEPAYIAILNAFENNLCYPRVPSTQFLDLCFSTVGSAEKTGKLPSFSITFTNGAVFWPPVENLFVKVAEDTMCLAIQSTSSPFGFNILGNLIQQNFEIVYDREKQRLGFAPAKCSVA